MRPGVEALPDEAWCRCSAWWGLVCRLCLMRPGLTSGGLKCGVKALSDEV